MASPAAMLQYVVTANTAPADAALARTQAKLRATGTVASSSSSKMRKAFAGVGLAAAGVGAVLFKVGQDFDDAFDKIRVGTGSTGKKLDRLESNFRNVVKSVPVDFDTASTAITELNKRLDLTGKPLQKTAKQFAALSRITGDDVSGDIEAVSKAFQDWEVKTSKQNKTLDGFFRLSQESGMSIADIAQQVQQFGSPLRQLGFELDESAAMFAGFEKAGVNTQTMVPGLKQAISHLTRPTATLGASMKKLGIDAGDPEKALDQVFTLMTDKGLPTTEKIGLAMDVFGMRAGPDMAEAIKQGRFEVGDLLDVMHNGHDTIRGAEKQTRDFSESWQLFTNRLKLQVEPIATKVFEGLGKLMKDVGKGMKEGGISGAIDVLADKLADAAPKIMEAGIKLGGAIIRGVFSAFKETNLLGKLFIGGSIFLLFGGKGLIRAGMARLASYMAARFAAIFAAEAATGGLIFNGAAAAGTSAGVAMGTTFLAALGPFAVAAAGIFAGIKAGQTEAVKSQFGHVDAEAQPLNSAVESLTILKDIKGLKNLRKEMSATKWPEDLADDAKMSRDKINAAIDSITGKSGDLKDNVSADTKDTARNVDKNTGNMERDATHHHQDMKDRASKASGDMKNKVGGNVFSMVSKVVQGYTRLKDNTNAALKAFNAKPVNFALVDGKKTGTSGLQRGGPIGGSGTGDRVPAMLEPGEYVMNRKAVAGIGKKRLDSINFGHLARFQKGGGVGLDFALGPYDIPPIQYDPNHAGGNSHVHLSMTSVSAAQALAKQIKPMGWLASEAPWAGGVTVAHQDPGHYTGSAFDANTAADETRSQVSALAHVLGGAGGVSAGMAQKLARVILKGPKGPLKDMGQRGLDKVRGAANAFIAKQAPSVTAGPGSILSGIDGSVASVFAKVAKKLSTSKTATLALFEAGLAESGMRDLGYGDSSSQGALQLLASTAAGFGVSPHDEAAVASLFLTQGYWGKGSANSLAAQGLPAATVAHLVQGNATGTGVYSAQQGAAQSLMGKYGLRKGGMVPYVGSYASGGTVPRDGIAKVHKGEKIRRANEKEWDRLLLEETKEMHAEQREWHRQERQARNSYGAQARQFALDAILGEVGDITVRNSRYAGNGQLTNIGGRRGR